MFTDKRQLRREAMAHLHCKHKKILETFIGSDGWEQGPTPNSVVKWHGTTLYTVQEDGRIDASDLDADDATDQ